MDFNFVLATTIKKCNAPLDLDIFQAVHIPKLRNILINYFSSVHYIAPLWMNLLCYDGHFPFYLKCRWNMLVSSCFVYWHLGFHLSCIWKNTYFLHQWCEFHYLRGVHVKLLSQSLIYVVCVNVFYFFLIQEFVYYSNKSICDNYG